MTTYKPSPENDLRMKGKLLIVGVRNTDTGKTGWALPGGTVTHNKRQAHEIALKINELRMNEKWQLDEH